MAEIETQTEALRKTADKKAYMREYMKKRYDNDKDKSRMYRISLKYKTKYNTPQEEFEEYGIHLANIIRLRKLLEVIPKDILNKVLLCNQP